MQRRRVTAAPSMDHSDLISRSFQAFYNKPIQQVLNEYTTNAPITSNEISLRLSHLNHEEKIQFALWVEVTSARRRLMKQPPTIKETALLGIAHFYQVRSGYTHEKALTYLSKAAANSEALGHYYLGEMHRLGMHVPENLPQAILCFKAAANLDFAPAFTRLALSDTTLAKNKVQDYFSKAALFRDAKAMFYLARHNTQLFPLYVDMHLLRDAARLGEPMAMRDLARIHHTNRYHEKSALYYRLAAERGTVELNVFLRYMREDTFNPYICYQAALFSFSYSEYKEPSEILTAALQTPFFKLMRKNMRLIETFDANDSLLHVQALLSQPEQFIPLRRFAMLYRILHQHFPLDIVKLIFIQITGNSFSAQALINKVKEETHARNEILAIPLNSLRQSHHFRVKLKEGSFQQILHSCICLFKPKDAGKQTQQSISPYQAVIAAKASKISYIEARDCLKSSQP